MKLLIALFLLIATSVFGAVPAYTSFKGTAGILITSNPPTGDITISGAGVFTSSGTNATISTSTNGVIVAFASTNINFVRGTNVVLTATNSGSVTHIGIHAISPIAGVAEGQSITVTTNGAVYTVAAGLKDFLMSSTNRFVWSNGTALVLSPTNDALFLFNTNNPAGIKPALIFSDGVDGAGFQSETGTIIRVVTVSSNLFPGTNRNLGRMLMRQLIMRDGSQEEGRFLRSMDAGGAATWAEVLTISNVVSLSVSNLTSKPITNSVITPGILYLYGLEGGTNVVLTMNGSNIVINSAGSGGGGPPGGDSGAIQFNQDDTFAGTNRFTFDRTNEILYVAGSVGIGTATPTYTLDVQAAIGSQRIVSTTSANETWLTFINNGAALIGLESSVPGTIVAGSSAYSLLLANQYAYPVQLATDNAVRMTILPTSGNVGIGTVSPTNTLDVQGHTSLRSNLFLSNLPTNGSPVAVLAVDAAGKVYETAVPSGGGSSVAPPISSVQFNSNGVQQGSANFTFTNNQVYINNPGAVGSAQLRLENTTQAAAWDLVIDSNPETYFLGIRNGASYTTVWEPAGNVGIGTTNPANRLDVEGRMAVGAAYSGTSIAPTDGLIVVGNVGIGTNTVGAQLHVRPATSGGNYFRIDDTNGTPRFQFRVFPTAPHIAGLWMGDVTAANYAMLSDGTNTEINGASSVLLEVAGFAIATVVSNGVGINTAPTNMLDVSGHTSLRSNLFLANLPTNGSPIAFLATDAAGAVYETAVPTGSSSSSETNVVLTNLVGTVANNVTNFVSLSTSNAISKPLTNSYAAGVVTVFGLEGGSGVTIAPNGSNLVISSSASAVALPISSVQFNSNGVMQGSASFVFTNGQVGIGTATPGTVNGVTFSTVNAHTKGAFGYALFESSSGGSGGILINDASQSADSRLWSLNINDTAGGLSIGTMTDGGATTQRFIVDRSGNVGIGTNAPLLRLDVAGGIRSHSVTASRIAAFHTDKTLTNGATTVALLDNFFAMGITNITNFGSGIVIGTNGGTLTISNSATAGSFSPGNSNQIPFLNLAGTAYMYAGYSSLTNPGFGFQLTGPNADYGGLMVYADKVMGSVTIGHPNPASDYATFATALVVSNRYNGAGNFKNDMIKFDAVLVNASTLQADSTMTRWRVWQAPSGSSTNASTSSNDVAELTIGGVLKLAGGIRVGPSGGTLTNTLYGSATLNFPSTVAGTVSDLPITVAGAEDGDIVALGEPSGSIGPLTGVYNAWASNGVVYVRFANNHLVTAQDPASGVFKVRVDKFQ